MLWFYNLLLITAKPFVVPIYHLKNTILIKRPIVPSHGTRQYIIYNGTESAWYEITNECHCLISFNYQLWRLFLDIFGWNDAGGGTPMIKISCQSDQQLQIISFSYWPDQALRLSNYDIIMKAPMTSLTCLIPHREYMLGVGLMVMVVGLGS